MVYQTVIKDYNLLIASILLEKPKEFIDRIREEYDAIIQVIDIDAIFDREHVEEIIKQVLEAYERNIMVSKHIETEILLRIACINQIYKAIEFAGSKPNKLSVFIALSKDISIIDELTRRSILNDINHYKNTDKLIKYHNITDNEINAVIDDCIRSILIEKANLIY